MVRMGIRNAEGAVLILQRCRLSSVSRTFSSCNALKWLKIWS